MCIAATCIVTLKRTRKKALNCLEIKKKNNSPFLYNATILLGISVLSAEPLAETWY